MKYCSRIALLGISVFALACAREEAPATRENSGNGTLTLVSKDPVTRITVSDKDESGYYKFNWSADDAVGLFASGLGNTMASITDAEEGSFEAPVSLEAGASVNIYHPYSEQFTVSGGVITGSILSEQSNESDGSAMFAGGFSWAKGNVSEDGSTVNFALTHPLAYFKVELASSEFSSWTLKSLTLIDKSAEPKALSGDFTFNYDSESLEPAAAAKPWVRLEIGGSVKLSTTMQSFWFSSFPADFTGSEVWLAVEMYDSASATSVTIPMKFSNANLKGGFINRISVPDLSLEDNDASLWYEPVEKRGFSGLGYAYGESNTFMIQCKNGKTIAGATYTPVDEYSNTVTISTKARGDFRKVVDPRGATFEWAKVGAVNEHGNGTGNTYTCAVYNYKTNDLKPTQYSFTASDKAEVTVKNNNSIAGSPILLMVKDGRIIWSWTFWNITADGTTLQPVGTYGIANMDIGQATTDVVTWASSKREDGNVDVAYRSVNYYVWGRPMPIFYANDAKACEYYGDYTKGSVPGVPGPMTFEESVAHPVGMVYNKDDKTAAPFVRWISETVGDLWGCCSSKADAVGTKTIFDPCPKGWRVADQRTYQDIIDNAILKYDAANNGRRGLKADDLFFLACGRYGNQMQLASNNTDYYWKAESTGVNGATSYGARWTNRLGGTTMQQPFYFRIEGTPSIKQLNMAFAAPVRCQKDTDER